MNEQEEYPPGTSTWQFNFKFNLTEDMYAQDSIELLTSSGIQFKKHEDEGIEALHFAEVLMTSGVILCEGVKWLSFHSGYDFGYLIKILTNSNLPEEELDFFEMLRLFFPVIYDVKYLMKSCKNLKGGLQEVAEQLELERIGPQHQAGSDSLLTGMAFFKMRERRVILIQFVQTYSCEPEYMAVLYRGLDTLIVSHGCFLKIILMMPNIAAICMVWAPVLHMYKMAQEMHTKKKPTSSSHDMKGRRDFPDLHYLVHTFYLWLNHLNNDAYFAFSAHFIFCLSVFCGTSIPNPDFHLEAEDVLRYVQPEIGPSVK
ncbi:CCR4-NOT transcription complex subunit 7 isoform X3 [Pleurodeles waltl]